MHLYLLLSFLISVATIVSTGTMTQSIQIHHDEEHESQIDLCTTMPPTSADMQPTSQQYRPKLPSPGNGRRRSFVSRGRDDHEKSVALCEAGFVSSCQQAIQEGAAEAPTSYLKTLPESALALLSGCFSDGPRDSGLFWLIFIMVSVALVRVALFFRQARSEFPDLKDAEKGSHDA